MLEAALHTARALALEHRLPEPGELKEAFLPPLAHRWRETLPLLSGFIDGSAPDWKPVAEGLAKIASPA